MSRANQIKYREKKHEVVKPIFMPILVPIGQNQQKQEYREVSKSGDIYIIYEYLSGKCGAGESCNCKARFYTMRDDIVGESVGKYDYEVENKDIMPQSDTLAARGLSFAATTEETQRIIRSR